MDFEFAERGAVESVEGAMQMTTQFVIKAREKLRDLLLCDGGREVNIPDRQAGEGFHIAREQAMQKCGATAQVAKDKERLFDRLGFMTREENVVEPETEPMD